MVDQQLPPPTLPASAATQNSATTELIHLTYRGNFQLDTEATVLFCRVIHSTADAYDNDDDGDDRHHQQQQQQQQQQSMMGTMDIPIELQLDITTMHPQGGGQPTDIGSIAMVNTDRNSIDEEVVFADSSIVANIEKVTIDRKTGIVTHAGTVSVSPKKKNNNAQNLSSIIFPPNSRVKVCVHPYIRRLLSECHTAGHVVDAAMSKCGKLMKPIKGYHFLDGPYVEYQGSIDANEREEFLSTLQSAYQDLIDEDIPTNIQMLPVDEAEALCNRLAQNFNMAEFTTSYSSSSTTTTTTDERKGKDLSSGVVRVVTVAGWNCPCGGTHVRSTGALKERGWGVKGLKCKKGVVRVRYGPNDDDGGAGAN